jgi:hypothetical protein
MASQDVLTRLQKALTIALVAFALISLGYALGKQNQPAPASPEAQLLSPPASGTGAVVLFLHPTQRCLSCNTIQDVAELVIAQRREEVQQGHLVMRSANYQKRTDLAEELDVLTSTVVVVAFGRGRLLGHRQLEAEVVNDWRDTARLESAIDDLIQDALARSEAPGQ